MADDIASVRAKLASILHKSAFDKALFKKMDKLITESNSIIQNYLEAIGLEVVHKVRELIVNASGTGRHYKYVDPETKEVLDEWTASSAGSIPVNLSETLLNAIEYHVKWDENIVEIGVWSDAPGGLHPTTGFSYGKLYVGEGGTQTPVSIYAEYLEHGSPGGKIGERPFLEPAFDEIVIDGKREITKLMKTELESIFGRKLPVYFRIYTKK